MAIKTQGTHLYAIDPADDSVLTVGCVTSIDGIDTTLEQIETTCLDSPARTYLAGLATPGAATFGINVDPSDPSHIRLHELKVSGAVLEWAIGWSDGTAAPTNGFSVDSVTIGAGGTGYVAPTVVFGAAPAGGVTATGTVQSLAGVITGVTITNPGSGYLVAPSVTITGAPGSGATATSVLEDHADFVIPNTRTFLLFDGFMNSYPFSFAQNAVVTSTVGIQVSGEPTLVPKV